jgi:CRP/FNR family transcriptional regulator, cyclic AMP receptor protein
MQRLCEALVNHGVIRRYKKNAIILQEGDVGDTVYAIISGEVRAYSSASLSAKSDKEITYGVYGVGEIFGEMSLDGGLRTANVVALSATVCAAVSRNSLKNIIAQSPELALDLLDYVILKSRITTKTLSSVSTVDVYGRLTACISDLATGRSEDNHPMIVKRITHAHIASMIGASREMVSRLLKDLERGAYIRLEHRRIIIVHTLPERW